MLVPKKNFTNSLNSLLIAQNANSSFELLNRVSIGNFNKKYYNVIGVLY